jgi:hypothetical protein
MNISYVFKIASEFYIVFARKGLKKWFLILKVSFGVRGGGESKILPAIYGGPALHPDTFTDTRHQNLGPQNYVKKSDLNWIFGSTFGNKLRLFTLYCS